MRDLSFGLSATQTCIRLSAERREIIEILEDEPNGLGPMDIADGLGRTAGSTRKLLTIMQSRGLIKRRRRGVYTINDPGIGNIGNTGIRGNSGNSGD